MRDVLFAFALLAWPFAAEALTALAAAAVAAPAMAATASPATTRGASEALRDDFARAFFLAAGFAEIFELSRDRAGHLPSDLAVDLPFMADLRADFAGFAFATDVADAFANGLADFFTLRFTVDFFVAFFVAFLAGFLIDFFANVYLGLWPLIE